MHVIFLILNRLESHFRLSPPVLPGVVPIQSDVLPAGTSTWWETRLVESCVQGPELLSVLVAKCLRARQFFFARARAHVRRVVRAGQGSPVVSAVAEVGGGAGV